MACNHFLRTEGQVVEFKLEIFTCDHFSSLYFGLDDERIIRMQEALQKSQDGILEGRPVSYLMQKFNLETLAIQVHDAITSMLRVIRGLTKEEREDTKLVLLLNVLPSVLSYYKKCSYFIAKYASDRYNIQLSCSNLTVQHLAEFFSHRGGKGNLGKVLTAETCAKISVAMTGKKHSAKSRAKMSEAKTGKKHTDKARAKMSKAQTGKKGKKHTAETIAKISKAKTSKKHTDKARAKMSHAWKKRKGMTANNILERLSNIRINFLLSPQSLLTTDEAEMF
jgi:hypothetical protein